MSINTSFIIPHKGREDMLIETLTSIANLQTPQEQYEVILVSQNKEISTALSEFKETVNLRVVHSDDNNTISHSRNLGADLAAGKYLAFLDADISLASNWLNVMIDTINTRDNTVLVSAMQVNSPNAPPLERIRTALSNAELDVPVNFLPGRNLFLLKSTFEAAGRFPEHLLTCEDYFFTDKVNKLGELFYTSQTQYVHIGEDKAYLPMYKKEIWRGQSNIASLRGRHIPLREWPSFIVPFAFSGGLLIAVLAIIFSQPVIAMVMLLGALLPFAAYTLRLKRLVKQQVTWWRCSLFYLLYFPARAIGTLIGVRGAVSTSSHK
ncbi:glycosyltransferase [Alteromonas gracilis]|uniref:glycosyltransferase n=1 Tax=Alteromonas gracilis TaxID=1479524 RepID=UPI003735EDD8